jgi:D-alanyl-D-alanine carboxypeptidase/D-alanyl-D-alanine-endopeptidase (penicillin-binding protein 4)
MRATMLHFRSVLPALWLLACGVPEIDVRSPEPPADVPDRPDRNPGRDPTPDPRPDLPPTLDSAIVAALTDAIDREIDGTPFTWGAHVIDLENGQIVYTRDADRPLKPASNTKLLTTAATLDLLGPFHRPEVALFARARPSAGTLAGDLVVVGGHDGAWSSYVHRDPDVPAERLAEALARAGTRRITGDLRVRGELVYEPHRFATFDAASHRARAADALRAALGRRGITVDGAIRLEATLDPPTDLVQIHLWRGSTIGALAAIINKISHNELADLMARHLGHTVGSGSSYAAFDAVVASWAADRGLPTEGLRLRDGSGLSHDNRVTARLIAELFQTLEESAIARDFLRSLSIGGYDGTLEARLAGPDTEGRFFGKTGTLRDTIATSGVLHHPHDGHRYAIALIANDVGQAATARTVQDGIIRLIARDWRNRGERPAPPVARALAVDGDRATLTWDAPGSADATEVWISDDGETWARERATTVSGEVATLRNLGNGTVYTRLIAVNEAGRSEPSDVLAARADRGPRLLLVDGNDRWDVQIENPLGDGHDFLARVARELPGAAIDSASNEAVRDGDVPLADYDGVLWLLGEESTEHLTFDADERRLVRAFVAGGGALVASGAEIGWDLDHLGDADARAFVREVLGGRYVADSAETWLVEPAEARFAAVDDAPFVQPGHLMAWYPDVLAASTGSRAALGYAGGTGGAALIVRDDARVAWAGFPIEALDDPVDRRALLDALRGALDL